MKKLNFLALTLLTALPLLAGCGGVSDTLGLNRKPIDEFQVTTRSPLAIPPEYTLRPPVPGAPRPQEESQRNLAARTVLGIETQDSVTLTNLSEENLSAGEIQFLEKTGGLSADPAIRQRLLEEGSTVQEKSEGYLEFLNPFLRSRQTGDVLDPVAERARLSAGANPERAPEDEPGIESGPEQPADELPAEDAEDEMPR